jgi:type II secretory pathway predicted ATPase ExeA
MTSSSRAKALNPFRKAGRFVCGEPQDEALARIEYLSHHGAGWCLVGGPRGIGKSTLLTELARRASRRGEFCAQIDLGPSLDAAWWSLVAEAWGIEAPSPMEVRRRLEEHLIGLAALNRPAWLLIDHAEPLPAELVRGCRWLVAQAAQRCLKLLVAVAGDGELELCQQADLRLELWPWDATDSGEFIGQCLGAQETTRFSDEAIMALQERTGGVPGTLAQLCEWTWLAAQAESARLIEADLVHAVADELLPSARKPPSYEMSAAYGAW